MRSNWDSRPLPTSKPAFSWSHLVQKLPVAEEHNPPPAAGGSHQDLLPPRITGEPTQLAAPEHGVNGNRSTKIILEARAVFLAWKAGTTSPSYISPPLETTAREARALCCGWARGDLCRTRWQL